MASAVFLCRRNPNIVCQHSEPETEVVDKESVAENWIVSRMLPRLT
jgi:hypothetical protein